MFPKCRFKSPLFLFCLSNSSILFNRQPKCQDKKQVVFLTIYSVEITQLWYPLSKTLAEGAAWKFAKENGIDLVTLHPGYVIGPLLQPTLNFTSEVFLNLIKSGTLQQQIQKRTGMIFYTPISFSDNLLFTLTVGYPSQEQN